MMLEMEKMILAARVTFPLDRMTFPFINSNDFSVHLGDIFPHVGLVFSMFPPPPSGVGGRQQSKRAIGT